MRTLLRTVGYGIILYALMYLAWALLGTYGLAGTLAGRAALLAVLVISTALATRSLGTHNLRDTMPHAISWLVVIAALDCAFAAPNGSWSIFANPNLWLGYLLVLGTPLVVYETPMHQVPTQA